MEKICGRQSGIYKTLLSQMKEGLRNKYIFQF